MPSPLIAVVGDVHGSQWAMIRLLSGWEKARNRQIDFVLQVGDFEPHRNEADLNTMAAPSKYRHLGDFAEFAAGHAHFPWPIWFIGGNHEPYGWLETMPEGGDLAPYCQYIGRANIVEVGGLLVAGLSGIFKQELFRSPRPLGAQFGTKSNKEWISWNEGDIERLLFLGRADVLLLHEWPYPFDSNQRHEPHGEAAQWIELLLTSLQPQIVFCGHLHFRFRGATQVGTNTIPIPVECLAQVPQGRDSFAVYEVENDSWREIP